MSRIQHHSVVLRKSMAYATFIFLFLFLISTVTEAEIEGANIQADQLFTQGDYREALSLYRDLLANEKDGEGLSHALERSVLCLKKLNLGHEQDALVEEALGKHPGNWWVLVKAAETYLDAEHYGYIIAGEFRRGQHRGGKGAFVTSNVRDRVRALQLFSQARVLVREDKHASESDVRRVLQGVRRGLIYERQGEDAWKLQHLTNLDTLPDYGEGRDRWFAGATGAPVDSEGQPLVYGIPGRFTSANSDGERWRFLLQEIAKISETDRKDSDFQWASFLYRQFGVQTLRYSSWFRQQANSDGGLDAEKSVYQLQTLSDQETIAKLASGIQRFKLKKDFNYIAQLKNLAEGDDFAESSLELLATLYENRRQLSTAAHYRQELLKRFDDKKGIRQAQLDQIVGAWAKFEPSRMNVSLDDDQSVYLRYRNAHSVEYTIFEIKTKVFLEDFKKHLQSNSKGFNRGLSNFETLGYQIVEQGRDQYQGKKLKSWIQDLDPSADHFDRRAKVSLPADLKGAWLLQASVAGGNTSFIVVWNTDALIVNKAYDGAQLYYVADSLTGAPLANVELSFFGVGQKRSRPTRKTRGQNSSATTLNFSATTNKLGQIVVGQDKMPNNFRWLVHTDSERRGFAVMGLNSIWFRNTSAQELKGSKAWCVTDQPVYRPGQKIQFKAWVREARYDLDNENLHAGKTFTVFIKNPKGELVYSAESVADEYGGLSGEFMARADMILGRYTLGVERVSGSGAFRVEEYKKPEFEVSVTTPSKPTQLGEKVEALISAKYLFGAPVANARVQYKVTRQAHNSQWFPSDPWDWFYEPGYWWFNKAARWYPAWQQWGHRPLRSQYLDYSPPEVVMEGETDVDEDGKIKIAIDTQMAKLQHGDSDHRYQIVAEVRDQSRRTVFGQGSVLVSRQPYQVYAWQDKGYYQAGDVVKASFSAMTLDKKPIHGKGQVKLFKFQSDDKKQIVETLVEQWQRDTNDQGKANLTFKVRARGQYRIVFELADEEGNEEQGGFLFNVMGAKGEKFAGDQSANSYRYGDLEIIPDRKNYQPGEKLRLMVNSDRAQGTVLLFLRPEAGIYRHSQLVKLNGKTAFVEIDIGPGDMPNFFIEALMVANGKIYSELKEIAVPPEQRVLDMQILTPETNYLPGSEAEVTIKLSDVEGKPFVGSAVLAVYDKALEYIAGGDITQDIKAWFWKWRRYHHASTRSSGQQWLGNMAQPKAKQLQSIGVFGDRITEDTQGQLDVEEVSVMGRKSRSASIARSRSMPVGAVAEPEFSTDLSIASSAMGDAGSGESDADSGEVTPDVTIRKDFADSAYWNANIMTDSHGIAKVKFKLPENLTTWKVAGWALGSGTRVGQASEALVTRKNLLLRMQAPRFFIEKDEVVLSANIHNYLDKSEKVNVKLELDGDTLQLLGKPNQKIKIAAKGERRVDWRVRVVKEGQANIRMLAIGQKESDAMQLDFPVYVHGAMKTESFSGAMKAEQNRALLAFSVPQNIRPEQTRFEMRYSPSLAGALVDALPYLVHYPYACTEQTLNRFLPTLMVQNVLKKTGLDLAGIQENRSNLNAQDLGQDNTRHGQSKKPAHPGGNPVFDEKEVDKMTRTGLARLASMQLSDGGWGWFSGRGETSMAHTTAYIVQGLHKAEQAGLNVDAEGYLRGLRWLAHYQAAELQKLQNAAAKVKPYKTQVDNIDAFVAMVLLDKTGSEPISAPQLSMLNFLYRDRQHLSVYGKTLLAHALHGAGMKAERDQVRSNIEQYLVQDEENQTAYLRLNNQNSWWYWYGNDMEAQAYYLKFLSKLEPKSVVASRLVKYLLNNRKHAGYWQSTRDTALVIEAMADHLLASGEINPDLTIDLKLDGKKIKSVKINRDNFFDFDNKLVLTGESLTSGEHQLEVLKQGPSPLYYNAWLSNFTLEDFITKTGLEVKVERRYYKLEPKEATGLVRGADGQAIIQNMDSRAKYTRIPVDKNTRLKSGDLVEIELVLESKNDYEYIVIEDMKAAGFEPLDVRSGYNGNALGAYVEYRDNRVAFFVSRLARGKHSVSYRLKAEIPGKFSALPTRVKAMYAPGIVANSDENKLMIVD